MSRSIIRELLKLANKPGIISFAGGLPNPQTFPHEELKQKSVGSGNECYQNMPKFIYTIPDFQNPSGITMSLQRRKELLNIVEEFLRRGLLDRHIEANITLYRSKLRCMLAALEEHMPRMPGLTWVVPRGGMFLWITLPEQMDADEMFKEAIERNVAYVVGSAFYPNSGGHNTMRLNFSYSSNDEIREGIKRLAGMVRSRQRGVA